MDQKASKISQPFAGNQKEPTNAFVVSRSEAQVWILSLTAHNHPKHKGSPGNQENLQIQGCKHDGEVPGCPRTGTWLHVKQSYLQFTSLHSCPFRGQVIMGILQLWTAGWLSTGGWQRIRESTCWTLNIQETITSVFALFVPFWFPVVTSTIKSSPLHSTKDSQNPTPLSLNSAKHCKIQKITGVHYYGAVALLLMFTTCVVFSIYLLFIQLQSLMIALSPWNTSQMDSCPQEVAGVNFLWENLWPLCWIWEHQSQLAWGVHGKKKPTTRKPWICSSPKDMKLGSGAMLG